MSSVSDRVKDFYGRHPYPSYGTVLKTKLATLCRSYCSEPGMFLEAGCGTGHMLVGTATSLPHLEYWAIDLSEASIRIAENLAREHGVTIRFRVHDLMEPLPFDFAFRYISCLGVLHHVDSPEIALGNLVERLENDGVIFVHVYGEDYHRRRLQIKEMLDLISGSDDDPRMRFTLFRAYAQHSKRLQRGSILRRLYRLSMRDVVHGVTRFVRHRVRPAVNDEWLLHAWQSELETPAFSERWLDQFSHPNERTYDLNELCALLDGAGLEPVEMFSLGKTRPEHLPPEWADRFEALGKAHQCRLMELLNPSPTSPFVAAKRKGRTG